MAYVAEEGVGVMSRITMVVSLFIVFLASIVPTHVARAASETVIVPFTSGDIGVQTQNTYSGNVTITVSGFGQAAGTSLSDAFYRFAEDGGSTPIVPELTTFALLINGQLAANYLQLPPAYRSDHTYTFTIHAPGARLRFSLAVGDAFVADNSGEFVVILTGGGNPGSTPNPSEAPAGYVSRPSDSVEDCQDRPAGVICLGFDDGYIWRVTLASAGDGICDWDENAGTWARHTIQVVTSCQGSVFKHIMETDYISIGDVLGASTADLRQLLELTVGASCAAILTQALPLGVYGLAAALITPQCLATITAGGSQALQILDQCFIKDPPSPACSKLIPFLSR